MTATVEETDLSTFENFGIPCEFPSHDKIGDGPAVWIVRFKVPMPCGCLAQRNPGFVCDACWQWRAAQPLLKCYLCGSITTDPMSMIESVERI